MNDDRLHRWKQAIPAPSVVLITGRRGSGKSALGYWLVEHLSEAYCMDAHVIGVPEDKWGLLPNSIRPLPLTALRSLPENAVIFVDEAALLFYSREWGDKQHTMFDHLLSVSRQKHQVLLLATHTARKLDVAIVMDADCWVCKEPSLLHSRLDRGEIRQFTQEALKAFGQVPAERRKQSAYVFCHEWEGGRMLENGLPSCWSDDLSCAFAGVDLAQEGTARATLDQAHHDSLQRRQVLERLLGRRP